MFVVGLLLRGESATLAVGKIVCASEGEISHGRGGGVSGGGGWKTGAGRGG